VKGDPKARGFRAHVGETSGAFSLRGFRFIRLDTQEARPLRLLPEQIDWFRSEVDAALAAGERVVIFQHNYPYQIWEDFAGPGIDDWRAIVQTRRITAIVCGHTHYGQVANDGRNVALAHANQGDRRPCLTLGKPVLGILPDGGAVPDRGGHQRSRWICAAHRPRHRAITLGDQLAALLQLGDGIEPVDRE
jgi:hypothetical protein